MMFNYKTEDGTRDTAETKYLPRIGELFMHNDNYYCVKDVIHTLDGVTLACELKDIKPAVFFDLDW